jgi:hypothetical protein
MQYATHRNSQTASDGNNTKRAAKRRKPPKPPGRVINPMGEVVKQVAQTNTNCRIATPEEEKRLGMLKPHNPAIIEWGGEWDI